MGKLTEFQHGYVIACANLVNLHDQPGMAADMLRELGVSWDDVRGADLSKYDMAALCKIKIESGPGVFVDNRRQRRKAGRLALAQEDEKK